MDYCPEIAVIHGAFALVERERNSGITDPLQHIKGTRSESLFLFIKAAIQEISVAGLEKPLNQQEQQYWGRHLHHLFFCKAFVFNSHFVHREVDEEKLSGSVKRFKPLCAPIPDFHPHLYFELSDEFGWAEFLGEMLASVDLPTALDFVFCCLTFCSPEPALLYDLSVMSTALDFLVSAHLVELSRPPHTHTYTGVTTSPDEKTRKNSERDSNGGPVTVSKQKKEGTLGNGGTAEATHLEQPPAGCPVVHSIDGTQHSEEDQEKETGEATTAVSRQQDAGLVGSLDETGESSEVLDGETVSETMSEKTQENGKDLKKTDVNQDTNDEADRKANAFHVKTETESSDVKKKTDLATDNFNETEREDMMRMNHSVGEEDGLNRKSLGQLDEQHQEILSKMVTLTTEMLALVQKRMSTKLFDRNTCKSGAMAKVLHVLGHILASTIVFSFISLSTSRGQEMRDFLASLMVKDEDHEDDDGLHSNKGETSASKLDSESEHLTPVSGNGSVANHFCEFVNGMVQEHCVRKACLQCLSSFFSVQSAPGGRPQKLSLEKSVKFGRVLKLNFKLCLMADPLKTSMITQELVNLLTGWFEQEKEETVSGLTDCISAILKEMRRREALAEERRLNPSLEEVVTKVQRRLPRWKWCLQYGLEKRDLKGWWFCGFLDLLHKDPTLLDKESDLKHLLSVLTDIANLAKLEADDWESSLKKCTELIFRTFSQLSAAGQENIILSVYTETAEPHILQCMHQGDIDQLLTVTFNKLSASTSSKDLQATLQLALHSPMTFTRHAVLTAISNRGQIPVVTKVLQLAPGVMKCVHPKHHPEQSLLCACMQEVLTELNLNPTEQKNVLSLVSLLVQSNRANDRQPPLLSASEFLASCALPFISTESAHPPISIEFALRLLIGCLDATLLDKNSDWLEEIYPAVIVACSARILEDNMQFVSENDAGADTPISMKSLVLRLVDSMHKHFYAAQKAFEGHDLCWLQEKCASYDWIVSAYLCTLLSPTLKTEENLLLAEFAATAVGQAAQSPVALLRLSATSDAAAQLVMLALRQQQSQDWLITEAALLDGLCQVLPNLLVCEVKRMVLVLSLLLNLELVEVNSRADDLGETLSDDFTGWHSEVMISQILMDAAVLVVSCHSNLTPGTFHHFSQVLVVALQTLLLSVDQRTEPATSPQSLFQCMFFHVCVIMSAGPDSILEPLFVVLLDVVSRLTQSATSSGSSLLSPSLTRAIGLIPEESLRETLSKKLESQVPGR